MAEFDYVKIKVVDLMIDRKNSTQVMESWEGHKISLKCAVTKAHPNSPVRFFWNEHSDGTSLIGKQVDWKEISQMTMVTTKDEDFQPVTCTAKTLATTQTLTIIIKRLCSPSAPLNLTNSLARKERPPFDVRIAWSPPEENGGSPVVQYSLEYKERGAPWIDGTELTTNNTYMTIIKNEKAYSYEVRVTARNKFGLGLHRKS
ncbi:hypothetical protein OS493_015202 [Desmophyllum pertusum]|uniref:Titin n=1 Tax=Desmophyllum pertusum TaxID=174260 RepID=A0A9W9ZQM2_9CNID|nr:hypothetical protein OS493_015202 [Desmophyllum pertusum]